MYQRPRPKPAVPDRVPAAAIVTAAEFEATPFGGHAGEWISGQAAPAPPPPQPLVIEPPEWSGEVGAVAPMSAPEQRLDALAAMRAEDGEGAIEWNPTAPPEVIAPLVRPLPPAPDWRAEEAERERVRAAEAQERLEATRDPYPARPAREKPPRWP